MPPRENMFQPASANNGFAIQVSDMTHSYFADSLNKTTFHLAEWNVKVGEHVFLYGDSGSGKSTLLNLLSGMLTPQRGKICIFGTNITSLKDSERDRFRARNIGVVFQQFNLIAYLSVLKNIELAAFLANSHQGDVLQEVKRLMALLELPSSILPTAISRLSVGQQQRIAIMRAFINSPKLLLIDEPTSALDNSAKNAFMTHLLAMCSQHKTTVIFVSHDLSLKHFFSTHTPISSLCSFHIQEAQ